MLTIVVEALTEKAPYAALTVVTQIAKAVKNQSKNGLSMGRPGKILC